MPAAARPTTTLERLAVLEAMLSETRSDVREIHRVLVMGDGDHKPLTERVAVLESHDNWRFRGIFGAATGLLSAALAYGAHLLTAATPR